MSEDRSTLSGFNRMHVSHELVIARLFLNIADDKYTEHLQNLLTSSMNSDCMQILAKFIGKVTW